MTSQMLCKARKYEEIAEKVIKKEERPAFHFSPRTGWMNDPNGFSYYKGKYHMFYQYYPYDTRWNSMHWGHAVSDDLLHWEYVPAALAPDENYDKEGCFSGSAIALPDGRQLLIYTGVARKAQEDGTDCEIQTQCIAVGDGTNYEKYENNPVLDEKHIPEGSSKVDFRDPKVWKKEDGSFACVVGNRPADGSGQILLYSSLDGFKWEFVSVLAENRNRFGKMWECPDFFELDGKYILLVSPQYMQGKGLEYHNGNGTVCFVGDLDKSTNTFKEESNHAIDYGIDFYAPQTVIAPDGRRIMIGWMQNWDTVGFYSPEKKWFGQMSLPREISVKNGRLYQWPIRELEELREEKVVYHDVTVEGTMKLEGIKGRKIDLELELSAGEDSYKKFMLQFAQNEEHYTSVCFWPQESLLEIDRKFSGASKDTVHERKCQVNSYNGKLEMRVILDQYSVEVFVNHGEQVLSATLYTDPAAEGITFLTEGKVKMNVIKYDLQE
ncbi:glycoside hydrolase family 32 protein [Blautia sp.]|uniref:glycoside hydrolase family 32 protein n=1 Tax=Blautia sp. TaxID=1955243 RepID=UPI0025862670|nr:glycoside hydrolase family 32 protein [Blautia sp.]